MSTPTLREAAQQARDYIRSTADYKMGHPRACEAALDLADALAEPDVPETDFGNMVEPIAWGMPQPDGAIIDCITPELHACEPGQYTVPLYTAPQPRKRLTSEEIEDAVRKADLEWHRGRTPLDEDAPKHYETLLCRAIEDAIWSKT